MIMGAALRARVFRFGLAAGASSSESELRTMGSARLAPRARAGALGSRAGAAKMLAVTSERDMRLSWLTRRPCPSRTAISRLTIGELGANAEGLAAVWRRLALSGGGTAGEAGALGAREPRICRLDLEGAAVPTLTTLGDFFPAPARCEDFCTTEALSDLEETSGLSGTAFSRLVSI